MKKIMLTTAGLTAILISGLIACQDSSKAATETASVKQPLTQEEQVKRGEYLVNTIGCDDCHTPKNFGPRGPEPDMANRFAGHLADHPVPEVDTAALGKGWALFGPELTVAAGPWGISYAANISSDSTGIGTWTEQQFIKAMREGKYKGMDNSRPMLPPMPWANFAKLTDEDLGAMFQYLQSTKPVKNVVPPAKIRS
jgi:mono/diheme cytochrome c family protein